MTHGDSERGGRVLDVICNTLRARMGEQEMQPPCEEGDLIVLTGEARSLFGHPLPLGYMSLLRRTNGLYFQDLRVFGTRRQRVRFRAQSPDFEDPCISVDALIESNAVLRSSDSWFEGYGVLGESEQDWLVINLRLTRFERIQQVGRLVIEAFNTFEELLWATLATRTPMPDITIDSR